MRIFIPTSSGTYLDGDGKIAIYSPSDFYERIVVGDDCFVCGAFKGTKPFNDEHILPNWLLSKFNLHNKTINLPNNVKVKYGQYIVPCCQECNTHLGRQIEEPISDLLKLSYSEVFDAVYSDRNNKHLLFKWLLLVFFKIHLKDSQYYWNLDRRQGEEKISETYNWIDMHHIHCMVRADYINAIIDDKVLGSMFILPALQHKSIEPFDLAVNDLGKTIMIRLNDIAVICILNDSTSVSLFMKEELRAIKNSLIPVQLREIYARATYININLKEKFVYKSEFALNGDNRIVIAKEPNRIELLQENEVEVNLKELLLYYCKDKLEMFNNKEEVMNNLKDGKIDFLFDGKGDFLDYAPIFNNLPYT